MRTLCLALGLLVPSVVFAQGDVFHGWSKDGTWLVYEAHGANDLVELYFCPSDMSVNPTWPAALNELDRVDERGLSCVRFLDANKAPYQWKNLLVPPVAGASAGGLEVHPELSTDGEMPGFVVQAGDKKQVCYASSVRDDSKLQKVWWQAAQRFVAVEIDGQFRHCAVTLKGPKGAAAKPPKKH
jgi:hypothetical protein